MDALETLFRPLAAMINRQIGARTPARELCRELDQRVLAMRVPDTGLGLYLLALDGVLQLSANYPGDPDVVLSGTPLSLARLAGPAGESLLRSGEIEISGDALTAQRFQKLLRYGRPDVEEELSGLIGDVAAHRVGEAVRGLGRWAIGARDTLRQDLGEYLQEESNSVPLRHEVDGFRADVSALRDDVARLETRLRHLEQKGA